MLRFLLLLLSIFLSNTIQVIAQDKIDDNQIYGLDPVIYNGKVYNYFPGVGVKGNQYFEQKDYVEGTISIRDHTYENLLLNYDILNQQLILKYVDPQGSNRLLIVSEAWLKKFSIGNEQFSIISNADGQKIIVQTLNKGILQMHIMWSKKLVAEINLVDEHYKFNENKLLYISSKNSFEEYNSTKDILALLSKENQLLTKSFLKKNKIKSRTTKEADLIMLLEFCNHLDL